MLTSNVYMITHVERIPLIMCRWGCAKFGLGKISNQNEIMVCQNIKRKQTILYSKINQTKLKICGLDYDLG